MNIFRSWAENLKNFLPYIFVFIASLYQPWDADLGWHLKYGEYFFKTGTILKENTFSTQMPDFIWANTSWGVDLIYYTAFALGGFLGLTILGALVVTLTFYFFSRAFDLSFWQKAVIFPFLIILEDPVNAISFRGQVFSVMLLGILMWILSAYERSGQRKKLFFLIPLFLFWANIHGQFILGFGVLGLWFLLYFFREFISQFPDFKIANFAS
ncbi:MAG: hypothetical protein Q8Q91_02135, partial [Candidatus Daviesbacteria bacterium]|nr:hypothetical protein [Candidatus Daviesbacteria bacterium]